MSPSVIYFGGSFDPIHCGHIDAVKIVSEAFPEARITIVPGRAIPSNSGDVKKSFAPFEDRVAMAVIAFDEWPRVDVSSIEEELPSPNYTFATLQELVTENPGAKCAWMIGADQLEAFVTWKNPRIILETVSLIVLPRPAQTSSDLLNLSQNIASSLGFGSQVDLENKRLDLDGAGSIYVLEGAPRSISSTEVRAKASVNLNQLDGLVPPQVIEYISDLGLYQ